MKQVLVFGFTLLFLSSLGSCGLLKKKREAATPRTVTVKASEISTSNSRLATSDIPSPKRALSPTKAQVDAVINTALTYAGVKYKYGGTSSNGMDCSGLLHVSFTANNISFPRVSQDMANEGEKISVKDVQKGDLLFFRTTRRSGRINHVGLVVDVRDDDIRFIHASTSRGVIVSSLSEGYWNSAFVKATRVF